MSSLRRALRASQQAPCIGKLGRSTAAARDEALCASEVASFRVQGLGCGALGFSGSGFGVRGSMGAGASAESLGSNNRFGDTVSDFCALGLRLRAWGRRVLDQGTSKRTPRVESRRPIIQN